MKKPNVTVSIPYFQCKPFIRRAVESILSQTYAHLTLIVVNDSDPVPPWEELSDIDDPRLIRFDLAANHGPYFANDVVLQATSDPYLMIQDADDWSDPQRLSLLLEILREDYAVAAFSDEHRESLAEKEIPARGIERFRALKHPLTFHYEFRANNSGLFKVEALRSVGGYYGGFRLAYDTLLINFLLMTGRIAYTNEPLYHRLIRPESLTRSERTDRQSETRRQAQLQLEKLYSEAFELYCEYLAGKLEPATLARLICQIRDRQVSPADRRELVKEARRLQDLLRSSVLRTSTPGVSLSDGTDTGSDKVVQEHDTVKERETFQTLKHNTVSAISVVIPARNESSRLAETIHSIHSTRSTGTPVEIVIVDDASEDGCCANMENEIGALGMKGLRLRVLPLDQHVGIYRARNYGAREASGDILFMTDAHVRFCPDWDRHVLENIHDNRILAATVTDAETGSKGYGSILYVPLMSTRWNVESVDCRVPIQIAPCSGTILYKQLFEEIGAYDPGMLIYGSGEPEFSVRAWLCGKEVLLLPKLEVQHRFKTKHERDRFLDQLAILRLHNRVRFGLLYLDDEMSKQMLEYFTMTYPDQAYAALKLIDESDVWMRKELLEQRRVLDIAWFMRRFEI